MCSSTNFSCSQCGELAASLTLSADNTLHQEGFWGVSREAIPPGAYYDIEQALFLADAGALYRLNSLWAPFYCPTCDRVYCRRHWTIIPQFDDDFPGWYDCAYGACPYGHRRLIDD